MVTGLSGKHTKMVQLVDLEDHTRPLGYDEHDTERGPQCYARMPYDLPVYVRVLRRVKAWASGGGKTHSSDHEGWTMEIDLYTVGVKVWIRIGRGDDNTLKIFLEDEEGREKVADYELQ